MDSRSVDLLSAAPAAKTESGTAGSVKEVAAATIVLPSIASIVVLNRGKLDHQADNTEINGVQTIGETTLLDPAGKTGDVRQRRPM